MAAVRDSHSYRIVKNGVYLENKVIKHTLKNENEHCRAEHGFQNVGADEKGAQGRDAIDSVGQKSHDAHSAQKLEYRVMRH